MRPIDADGLVGYTEERQALPKFERPYLLPSLAGVALFIVGFILTIRTGEFHYTLLCPVGMLTFLLTIAVMYRATPFSSHTGRPMEKYRYKGQDAACVEVAYVDPESKTYFRRVFMARGRSSSP